MTALVVVSTDCGIAGETSPAIHRHPCFHDGSSVQISQINYFRKFFGGRLLVTMRPPLKPWGA